MKCRCVYVTKEIILRISGFSYVETIPTFRENYSHLLRVRAKYVLTASTHNIAKLRNPKLFLNALSRQTGKLTVCLKICSGCTLGPREAHIFKVPHIYY